MAQPDRRCVDDAVPTRHVVSGRLSDVAGPSSSLTHYNSVHRASDLSIVVTGELVKTLVRETLQLIGSVVNGGAAMVLHFTFEPGYYSAMRNRMIQASSSSSSSSAVPSRSKAGASSGWGSRLFPVRRRRRRSSSSGSGVSTSPVGVSPPSAAALTTPSKPPRRSLGLPSSSPSSITPGRSLWDGVLVRLSAAHAVVLPNLGVPSRVRRYAERARRRVARSDLLQRQAANSRHTAGLLEDLSNQLLVLVDRMTWAARRGTAATWRVVLTPFGGAKSGSAVPFTHFDLFPVSTSIPRLVTPSQGHASMTVRAIAEISGYPVEQYQCRTVDGYLLTVIRIPRRSSHRVAIFQHGLLDSPSAWVSNGSISSMACRAWSAGWDVFLGTYRGVDDRSRDLMHVSRDVHSEWTLNDPSFWNFSVDDHMLDMLAVVGCVRDIKSQEEPIRRYNALRAKFDASRTSDEPGHTSRPDAPSSRSSRRHHGRRRRRNHPAARRRLAALSTSVPLGGAHHRAGDITAANDADADDDDVHHHRDMDAGGSGSDGAASAGDVDDIDDDVSNGAVVSDSEATAPPPVVPPIEVVGIGHSMGGASLLLYILQTRSMGIPHGLDKIILLSPAGYHRVQPLLTRLLTTGMATVLAPLGDGPFPVASSGLQMMGARLFQDLKRTRQLSDIAASVSSTFFGGTTESFVFNHVPLVEYPLGVCSRRVLRHGVQVSTAGAFMPWDYGKKENLRRYGMPKPPVYSSGFGVFDIPVHVVAGGQDRLIPAANLQELVADLNQAVPNVATYKLFPTLGHLCFTLGSLESVITHVLSEMSRPRPPPGSFVPVTPPPTFPDSTLPSQRAAAFPYIRCWSHLDRALKGLDELAARVKRTPRHPLYAGSPPPCPAPYNSSGNVSSSTSAVTTPPVSEYEDTDDLSTKPTVDGDTVPYVASAGWTTWAQAKVGKVLALALPQP